MYASGLQVIEYKGEFTEYDMPDKYFTKIDNDDNIENTVTELFRSQDKNSNEYKKSITIEVEKNNVITYFKNLLHF